MEIAGGFSLIDVGLMLGFVAFVLAFAYFAATMIHHWGYYSFNAQFKRIAQWSYLVVSVIILLALATCIGLYVSDYGISA